MKFPDGVTIKKIDGHGYRNCFAVDTDGALWVWGYKYAYDDYYGEANDEDPDLMPGFKDNWTPCKIEWFEKHGIRVVDIAAGEIYCILKTVDRQGFRSFYGFLHPDYHYQAKRSFGAGYKEVIKKTLFKLEQINANNVVSFDCGQYMINFVNKSMEKAVTIIPGRETPSGLTHAYKDAQK